MSTNTIFEKIIFVCIGLNTLTMCVGWFEQPNTVDKVINIFEYFFTLVFLFEAIFKIIALGKQYFYSNWNIFDFLIVIGTITGYGIEFFAHISGISATIILRSFRIARIFKLFRK